MGTTEREGPTVAACFYRFDLDAEESLNDVDVGERVARQTLGNERASLRHRKGDDELVGQAGAYRNGSREILSGLLDGILRHRFGAHGPSALLVRWKRLTRGLPRSRIRQHGADELHTDQEMIVPKTPAILDFAADHSRRA